MRLGEHVFRDHGINSDGDFSPAATAMWTVTPFVPASAGHSHRPVGLRPVVVAGRTFKAACKLGSGTIDRCSVTLVSPSGIVVGHGVRVFTGAHRRRMGKVEVVLTAKGRALAARPGGVRVVATAKVTPVGGATPIVVKQIAHVVAPSVHVTPGTLQFESGSAVLLPSGRGYLQSLVSQFAAARRVVATGYTDNTGNAGANYRLGLARADAVCAFIAQRAHVACRALSYGEGHPRATNATATGRALNRRVELRLTY
jgi:outer membrane protein OmpA-like peptidoglycan-associated protein